MSIRGVLFDWRGTLGHDPDVATWLRAAAQRTDRLLSDDDLAAIEAKLNESYELPHLAERFPTADISADAHRSVMLDWFAAAGLDAELAAALYALDLDPTFQRFFPDVALTFKMLHDARVGIAIVSDIHFDLRPLFVAAELDRFVNCYVLSYEHGFQKPDPRMFSVALDALEITPEEALMVGDNPRRDGGAASQGVRTLLVPPLPSFGPRGLEAVLALAGVSA